MKNYQREQNDQKNTKKTKIQHPPNLPIFHNPNRHSCLQNSSRFLLGLPLKLSHAPLQVHVPKIIKMAALLQSVFLRRV
jgi:hypothetical protein